VKNFRILLSIIVLVTLNACSPKGTTQKLKKSAKLEINDLKFDYYEAKGKFTFEDITQDIKSNLDVRLKKDSIIWMSIRSGAGIEGVRGIITKDSIKVINRLDKEYYAYSIAEVSEKFKFQFDFDMLQQTMVGNIPVNTDMRSRAKKETEHFVMTGNLDKPKANVTLYVNRYYDRVDKVRLLDKKNFNDVEIEYEDYRNIEGQQVPHIYKLQMNYTDNRGSIISKLKVDASRIILTPTKEMKFPFKVPSRYKKVDIAEEQRKKVEEKDKERERKQKEKKSKKN